MAKSIYEVRSTVDIAYATGRDAHPRRLLDIYAPADCQHYPVLLFVSGGGWTQGSKSWIGDMGRTLAPLGIGVVTIDHRLVPEVRYDGMVKDLALAFAWVKRNIASFGGNPDQVFVGGHSAGGHIMTLLAMHQSYLEVHGHTAANIAGVVSMSSTLSISAGYMDNMSQILGSTQVPGTPTIRDLARGDDRYADASPINHVREGLPPFLILYAQHELTAAIADQAKLMARLLEEAGVPTELVEVRGRDHFTIAYLGPPDSELAREISAWIFKTLQ